MCDGKLGDSLVFVFFPGVVQLSQQSLEVFLSEDVALKGRWVNRGVSTVVGVS